MPKSLTVVTRHISPNMSACELTCIGREPINMDRMKQQHQAYVHVFRTVQRQHNLQIEVVELPSLPDFPDAMFVEDVALMFPDCAVLTRPGAASRRGEAAHIRDTLLNVLGPERPLLELEDPATVDGGDVLIIQKWVFVGLSSRSNQAGFDALRAFLGPRGYQCVQVVVQGCLHLKSAVSLVTESTVLLNPQRVDRTVFTTKGLGVLEVDPVNEPEGPNVLSFVASPVDATTQPKSNIRTIVVAAAFPRLVELMKRYCAAADVPGETLQLVVVEADEVAKAEGALTCCSLLSYKIGA